MPSIQWFQVNGWFAESARKYMSGRVVVCTGVARGHHTTHEQAAEPLTIVVGEFYLLGRALTLEIAVACAHVVCAADAIAGAGVWTLGVDASHEGEEYGHGAHREVLH